jgi:hypothetical protein
MGWGSTLGCECTPSVCTEKACAAAEAVTVGSSQEFSPPSTIGTIFVISIDDSAFVLEDAGRHTVEHTNERALVLNALSACERCASIIISSLVSGVSALPILAESDSTMSNLKHKVWIQCCGPNAAVPMLRCVWSQCCGVFGPNAAGPMLRSQRCGV